MKQNHLKDKLNICLKNLSFYAYHGATEEERRVGTKYEIDASLMIFYDKVQANETIESTLDYSEVAQVIKKTVLSNKYILIETLAKKAVQELMDSFDKICSIKLKVRKMNPPIGLTCDYVEVEYFESKENQ